MTPVDLNRLVSPAELEDTDLIALLVETASCIGFDTGKGAYNAEDATTLQEARRTVLRRLHAGRSAA